MNKLQILSLSLCLTCLSCTRMLLSSVGLFNNDVVVRKIPNSKKEIYFIELKHVAQQEFYNGVLKTIDSFKKEGFYVLVEGVKSYTNKQNVYTSQDSLNIIKSRKLLGIIPKDMANIEGFKEIATAYKLISQPLLINLNATSSEKISDATLSEMILKYETIKGIIQLNKCDLNTPFDKKYECDLVSKENREFYKENIVLNFRDSVIAIKALNDIHSKILMVYGAAHFKGINKIIATQ